jgi:flagellar biosynthesis protein FlhG
MMNNLFRRKEIAGQDSGNPHLLAVASGKGGVGKSVIAFNLADHLSSRWRILLIDGDFQRGNLHLLGNITAECRWQDICFGRVGFSEAITAVNKRFDLLASSGGLSGETLPDVRSLAAFLGGLRNQCRRYDYVIFDTASGILPHTDLILHAVDQVILVTTPELTSISGCYALYKTLITDNENIFSSILVNHEDREDEIEYIYQKFITITDRFLDHSPVFFGSLSYDRELVEAVARQRRIADYAPDSRINRQLADLAAGLSGEPAGAIFGHKPINLTAPGADIRE